MTLKFTKYKKATFFFLNFFTEFDTTHLNSSLGFLKTPLSIPKIISTSPVRNSFSFAES